MYKLWPWQAQFMTILTFIWPLWPWPSTYLKICFKWHFSSWRTTTMQNHFEIHAKMYKLWPGQAQFMTILTFIWPLWPRPSTYLKKCFKWHYSSSRTKTMRNYFEIHALMYKLWPRQAQYKNILTFVWPLWPWLSTYQFFFSNGTSPPQG